MTMEDNSVTAVKAEVTMKQQADHLFLDAELTPAQQREVQRRVASCRLCAQWPGAVVL
jgi:50S ribosomal subunit-associated GTPase HflX